MRTAPFGSWESPVDARTVAAGTEPVHDACFLGEDIWYLARVSALDGRNALFRVPAPGGVPTPGSTPEALLPPDSNVRSRVHEYGGRAWAARLEGDVPVVYWVEGADQRIHRLRVGTGEAPAVLTPDTGGRVRYGDLVMAGGRLLAVRESHAEDGTVNRAIVEVIDRAEDAGPGVAAPAVVELARGPHFLAWPRLSPDGRRLAFIGWDHPHMPWDETALYVRELDREDALSAVRVLGRPEESLLQPEWLSNSRLAVLGDRSGRWDLYWLRVEDFLARASGDPGAGPAEEELVLRAEGEIGGPLWALGARWYLPVRSGHGTRILAEDRHATSTLRWAIPGGEVRTLDCPLATCSLQDHRDGTVLLIGGGPDRVSGLYTFHVASGELTEVKLAIDPFPDGAPVSPAEVREFVDPDTAELVHAVVYPPHNPAFTAPEGERPPYVAFVHGGPTGQVVPQVSLHHTYFTSRGIGVVDVNYGGSTGFGRAYRERLRGAWGIVDVADTVTVLRGLVAEGAADPDRLAISGGSAGGWTVLGALTRTDTFACGTSAYGVAELSVFVTETHDFESHYIEGLVGDPADEELYHDRAPLSHLEDLRVPVAVFQGELDPIVPPAQARRLIAALEDRGVPYTSLFFPNESHGFVRPDNVVRALEAELGFYGRVLGFEVPGVPPVRMQGRGR